MASLTFLARNAKLLPKFSPFILPKGHRSLVTMKIGGQTFEFGGHIRDDDVQEMVNQSEVLLVDLQRAINNQRLTPAELKAVMGKTHSYPSCKEGSKSPFGVEEDEENLYARIDMPGVDMKGAKLWLQNDYLYFSGEVVKEDPELGFADMDYSSKKYGGRFYLNPAFYQGVKMKAAIKNGVLRIAVPKVKLYDEETKTVKFGEGTYSVVDVEFE